MTIQRTLAVLVVLGWLGGGCGTEEPGGDVPLGRSSAALHELTGASGSYGGAIALDGDRLAIGSPDEVPAAIRLFVRRGPGWVEDGVLLGFEPGFYRAMALRGDLLAVGQPWSGAALKGQVELYRRRAEGWRLEATLEGPPDAPAGFGTAVALDRGLLFVGAPGGPEPGEVLVFAGLRGWTLAARLAPGARAVYDGFGNVLAAADGALAVAAPGGEVPAVVVFQAAGLGRPGWREQARLEEPGAEPDTEFGMRVALRDGVLVVGCGCPDGEAWVYRRQGQAWVREAELRAPWDAVNVMMAHAVAVSAGGRQVAVTAPGAEVDGLGGAGLTLVYARGPRGWALERTLRATVPTAGAGFGHALALDHGLLVVGAPGDAGVPGEVLTFSLAGP